MATKADATRWMDAHVGREVFTVQAIASNGRAWVPGPRTVTKRGKGAAWMLNGSEVRWSPTHVVTHVDSTTLVVEWHDEGGALIHTTIYAEDAQ